MARASTSGSIGTWEAASIGVGGMVGGGIFAVLGLSVQVAGAGTALAFALAGVVALLTAYSYARLSVAIRSAGGTVSFLDQAFGSGLWTGTLNVLLWLSYVVMLSLYAHAFGAYGATLLPLPEEPARRLLMTGILVAITALNVRGARVIGRAEDWIVGAKLAILVLFVCVGGSGIETDRVAPAAWPPLAHLLAGGMLIFVAYEGFELIANTAADARDPHRTLPRAYYGSVLFVIALYVAIALVAVGNLPLHKIVEARDYALAEAARPFLGQAGFTLVSVAALLSTASAINATLYGAARLSYAIARDGELPQLLERKVWDQPIEGLLVTAALAAALVNLTSLSSISTLGSAGFLILFASVNAANVRLAERTKSLWPISALGCLACLGALAALVLHTARSSPDQLWVLVLLLGLAFGVEAGYRTLTGREIRLAEPESG